MSAEQERRTAEDLNGSRQRQVVHFMRKRGRRGVTWKEVAKELGIHHGAASGVLSGLHKESLIERLVLDRREGCKVYVLPEFIEDRPTERPGQPSKQREVMDELAKVLYTLTMGTGMCLSHLPSAPMKGCVYCEAATALRKYEERIGRR